MNTKSQKPAPTPHVLDTNPNQWTLNSSANPFFKCKGPVEVQFLDGSRRLLNTPKLYEREAGKIEFWRIHSKPELLPFVLKFEWFRELTWKERFRILLCGNILVLIAVATRNNTGHFQPVVIGHVVEENKVEDYMEAQRKAAIGQYLAENAMTQ